MYGVIYKIICLVNGKIYIGQTTRDIKERWRDHCKYNSRDKNNNYFHNAIKKYGKENFQIVILCECDSKKELDDKEYEYIKEYNCRNKDIGYNICPGGNGVGKGEDHPFFGKNHTEEAKNKISAATSGENNPNYGKKFSEERKKEMSENMKGDKSPWYGKHLSDETKKKISEAAMGRVVSEKTKKKISEAATGRIVSEETKEKLSLIFSGENNPNYGKILSDEIKKKISKSLTGLYSGKNSYMYGKHLSDETKQKLSIINQGKLLSEETKNKISNATKGENNPRARLNWNDVNKIRDLYKTGEFTQKELAEKFSVGQTQISKIILNITWKI